MSITYEEALATLQSMFAEPWTEDTLDSVLRNQKGHMENTIDLILRHGARDPQDLVEQLESGVDPRQSETAADEALARQLSQQRVSDETNTTNSNNNHNSTEVTRNRPGKGKPATLADEFLRVPGFAPLPRSGGGLNSLSDDEALARMLQDELFTQELSRNPDFAHLATGRSGRASHASSSQQPSSTAGIINPAMAAANRFGEFARGLTAGGGQQQQQRNQQRSSENQQSSSVQQSPNIMDKISELGDNAKRRLQILAAQFNANNNNNGNNNANNNSLLLSSNNDGGRSSGAGEFRGLLDNNEDDNMELATRKDL